MRVWVLAGVVVSKVLLTSATTGTLTGGILGNLSKSLSTTERGGSRPEGSVRS